MCTATPGAADALEGKGFGSAETMNDLYILINNEPTGPFAMEDLQKMVESGEIPVETLYAREGMSSWEQLLTVIQVAGSQQTHSENEISPDAEIRRCRELSESLQTLSTYSGAREWRKRVSEEVSALPVTLRFLDQLVAAAGRNLDEEKHKFQQQSFLKRTFGSHDSEEAAAHRISDLRIQGGVLAKLVKEMEQKVDLVPDSQSKRDSLLKELRHHMKELKAKKKEATVAATEIRREARVAIDGAGKTWLGFYDPSLAADQRRGIRHAKEDALRPYEDTKETIERQLIALEKHVTWLENFE